MPKPQQSAPDKAPRIGVPWRTEKQERARDMRYNRDYLEAVRKAGGEPVQISLLSPPAKLAQIAKALDAFVLPGSPADVDPKLYGARAHAKAAKPDVKREKTDFALLKHALPAGKPVLAICYGIQSLNVYLGGSLYQDIPGELPRALTHSRDRDHKDAMHEVRVTGGRLAMLAGRPDIRVNSVHHQSVRRPGRGLRVTAKAPDGVIEAVEWTLGPGWALGVQWHPERTPKDPLAQKLFRRLVFEAAIARNQRLGSPARASRSAGRAKRTRSPRRARGGASATARATRASAKAPNTRSKSGLPAGAGRRK
jgi:putative glutamine amidotransferase